MTYVTRLVTPAILIGSDKDDSLIELTAKREYRRMHGYIPIPQGKSFQKLFDDVATPNQRRFIANVANPVAWRVDDEIFLVRVDLLSAERATDSLARSLRKTGRRLFGGRYGSEICVGSAGPGGVGIVCSEPETVLVFRLTTESLIGEFYDEINQLLGTAATSSIRRDHGPSMAYWLSLSLEKMLPERRFNKFLAVLQFIDSWCFEARLDAALNQCRILLDECLE